MTLNRTILAWVVLSYLALGVLTSSVHGGDQFTATVLGAPDGADTVTAVRMNNHGQIVGYSIYYGQGEPSIRPWLWTVEDGFTVLPPPPDMFLGRARAMDISDSGIIAGDGGFDAGIAWRWENGVYETFGQVGGMGIAYLGGVNEAGDVAGTAKDATITTEDEVFLDINGAGTMHLTPGPEGGRAVDINSAGEVSGYSDGSGFEAFIWRDETGFEFLGTLGLAFSYATEMNDASEVVGYVKSSTGNTIRPWFYSPDEGMQAIPGSASVASAINIHGQVVGTYICCGPDEPWIWTRETGVISLFDKFDYVSAGLTALSSRDINDSGQILLQAYDNSIGEFRPVLLTPVLTGVGACCLADEGCVADLTAGDCLAQGGEFAGDSTACVSCTPVGACCLTDGSCVPFLSSADCGNQSGFWQGEGSSCAFAECVAGVPNDDCANATTILLGDTGFSTLGATTDGPNLPQECSEPSGTFFGMDIWYTYVPDGDGVLTVSTCEQADYDTRLAAYVGGCGVLDIVGCNDNACLYLTSIMDLPVTCGEPVLIRVGSFSVYTGSGTLSLSFVGDPCVACDADVDGSGVVDVTDMLAVIAAWGTDGNQTPGIDTDINHDGIVGIGDLLLVFSGWGICG